MSLTLPAVYSSASKQGNIQENWIVQLGFFNGDAQGSGDGGWDAVLQADGTANLLTADVNSSTTTIPVDDGTVFAANDFLKIESEIVKVVSISSNNLTVVRTQMSTSAEAHEDDDAIYWNNFKAIALSDTTVDSVFYRGVITNKPSIRSSVNLAKSTAKTGNISLSLANFQYQGDDFSAELFLGTRKYINREVRIYSQLNGEATLSNCLQIYSGRLIDISHDDSTISLQLTEQRPWDFITTPRQRSSVYKHIFPIAYGDFVANQSSTGSETYCTGKKLFPIPIDVVTGSTINSLMFQEQAITGSGATSPNPHYYEKNLDQFIPLYETSSATADDESSSYAGGFGLISYWALKRALKFKPDGVSDAGGFASAANAFDTSDADDTGTSYTREVHSGSFSAGPGSNTSTTSSIMKLTIPQMSGKYSAVKVEIRARIHGSLTTAAQILTATCKLNNKSSGADTALATVVGQTPDSTFQTGSGYADYSDTFTTEYLASTDGLSTIDIEAETVFTRNNTSGDGSFSCFFDVVDVRVYGTLEIDFDETSNKNLQGGTNIVYSLDTLYSGGNGLDASYSGGSGSVITGLGMHRDLLARFTNYDAADSSIYNWDTSFPSSGSLDIEDLRLDSSSWGVRWWASEPIDLKKILEQIQYEFCFIFKWRADGSGSYWIIKDSYSSGDETQTFTKNDITNLKISNTPFSELLTKMDINYEKHPSESKYLSSQTSEDTTNDPRASWNIQSKENIKEINLDMNIDKIGNTNVGGNDPNDGFADYYMNIFGDIKKIISCDIVNPAVSYNLETGDIVQFSNTAGEMPVDPFGDNWADYYMITNLNRSPGKVNVTVREVG